MTNKTSTKAIPFKTGVFSLMTVSLASITLKRLTIAPLLREIGNMIQYLMGFVVGPLIKIRLLRSRGSVIRYPKRTTFALTDSALATITKI